jgi:hypothetical protein
MEDLSMSKRYRVTFYYLATAMDGMADRRDYGVVHADSEEEAKNQVIARERADNEYQTAAVTDEWFRNCLTATLMDDVSDPARDFWDKIVSAHDIRADMIPMFRNSAEMESVIHLYGQTLDPADRERRLHVLTSFCCALLSNPAITNMNKPEESDVVEDLMAMLRRPRG